VQREPLLAPFLALAAGIFLSHFIDFTLHEALWALASVAFLTFLSFAFSAPSRTKLACVLTAFSALGIATQTVHHQRSRPKLTIADGEIALVEGCVVDPPVLAVDKSQFTLEIAPGVKLRVSTFSKDSNPPDLRYGQIVEATAKVRSPHNFQNPGDFDYEGWLASQHIYWTGTVRSAEDIRVVHGPCGNRASAVVFATRSWMLRRLEGFYPHDERTQSLLKAILLGQTAGEDRRWTDDFRLTGTYHALVISGQHVAVLALSVLFLLRVLHLGEFSALSIAALTCWMYAFVSGLSAPVLRAAGGFSIFLVASYLFRRIRILNALALVGLIYLIVDPQQLFDPSFQLSFLSAAALAAFAIPLMEKWTEPLRIAAGSADRIVADVARNPRIATLRVELRLIAETLAVWTKLPEKVCLMIATGAARLVAFAAEAVVLSACIQFALSLPMIAYFHRFSMTGLSANVIVVPLLSCIIPLGFAAIFIGWHWLAVVTAGLLNLAEQVAAWHRRLEPWWRISDMPLWIAIFFACALCALAVAIRFKSRFALPAAGLAVLCFALICWQPWRPQLRPGWLEVSTIDVSQGDSVFVAFPDGKTMLVDGGGFPGFGKNVRKSNLDIGEDVVSPYLWSRRIRLLDYVVLTHGHSDHMDGLFAILDNFHPRELWVGPEPATPEWLRLRERAFTDGVQIRKLSCGTSPSHFGTATVTALAPDANYVAGPNAANNDSLVLLIEIGSKRILLTGDAERPVEDELIAKQVLGPIALLKVGHHGSKTSSSAEFLDATKPQFALISAGYLNQFHHPHPDVLSETC
jgi:competence protein ComEC